MQYRNLKGTITATRITGFKKMTALCPHCGGTITPQQAAALLRASKITEAQRAASRANGKKGGYPQGRKRGPRKLQTKNPPA